MTIGMFSTPADEAVDRAQRRLAAAQGHLQRAEDATYCCDLSKKEAIKGAKTAVKRWQTWLADRGELEAEQTALPGM